MVDALFACGFFEVFCFFGGGGRRGEQSGAASGDGVAASAAQAAHKERGAGALRESEDTGCGTLDNISQCGASSAP
jgi:hypothetical protein